MSQLLLNLSLTRSLQKGNQEKVRRSRLQQWSRPRRRQRSRKRNMCRTTILRKKLQLLNKQRTASPSPLPFRPGANRLLP